MPRGINEREAAPVAQREERFASGERSAVRYAKDLESEGACEGRGGFSGSCQNASLADWIQLIQMGRRDALIVVSSPGNREGRLWCKGGDIIDARWDFFTGEDAVYRILSFDSGEVTVDFTAFERPRLIHTPTAGLLLEAAYRKDTRVSDTPSGKAHDGPPGGGAGSMSTAPTVTGPPSLPPASDRAQKLRNVLWAASATVMLGIAFWLWWSAGSNAPAAASSAPVTAAAPAEDFPVHVEVQPDEAEIRLDGELVATRALMTHLPRDGRLHELIVSARGYVPELLTFRDRAPLERIALERLPPATVDPPPVRLDDTVSKGGRRAQVTHRATSAEVEAKSEPPPAAAPPVPVATTVLKPAIRTIDERQPRIQAIDEGQPRIEGIQ